MGPPLEAVGSTSLQLQIHPDWTLSRSDRGVQAENTADKKAQLSTFKASSLFVSPMFIEIKDALAINGYNRGRKYHSHDTTADVYLHSAIICCLLVHY